jgi:hypothetical protein
MEHDDPRFWLLDSNNEHNKIDAVQKAAGTRIEALVDEEAGGIVGYLLIGSAQQIVSVLNTADENEEE